MQRIKGAQQRQTYNVEEVARLFGIGRNQCYEAIRKGEIPSIPIGRRRVCPKLAIDRMLAGDVAPPKTGKAA